MVRFTGPPDAVYARVADHPAMTEWVPLRDYVGFMGVQPDAAGGGGDFVFREYFRVDGTSADFRQAQVPTAEQPKPVRGSDRD